MSVKYIGLDEIPNLRGCNDHVTTGQLFEWDPIWKFPCTSSHSEARLGAFLDSYATLVFFALGCTSITNIRADATKLICKWS